MTRLDSHWHNVSTGHKWQKAHLLPFAGDDGLEEKFLVFFVDFL